MSLKISNQHRRAENARTVSKGIGNDPGLERGVEDETFEVFRSFGIQSFNITEAATKHDDAWINNIDDMRQAFSEIKAKAIDRLLCRRITVSTFDNFSQGTTPSRPFFVIALERRT